MIRAFLVFYYLICQENIIIVLVFERGIFVFGKIMRKADYDKFVIFLKPERE